jgi:hypothetical protein
MASGWILKFTFFYGNNEWTVALIEMGLVQWKILDIPTVDRPWDGPCGV